MVEVKETVTPITLRGQIERQLEVRGISIVEAERVSDIEIPAVPEKPRIPREKWDEFKSANRETLRALGLPDNSTSIVREHLVHIERKEEEPHKANELEIFTFASEKGSGKKRPLVVFSHGFTIHEEYIQGTGYPTMVNESSREVIICAVNHPSGKSHETKADYNLKDRVTDLLVTTRFALEEVIPQLESEEIEWDGRVFLLGDSVGGHVVATLGGELDRVDGVMLTGPVAYTHELHEADIVYPGHKFSSGNTHKERHKNKTLWSASPGMVEEYVNDRQEVVDARFDPGNIQGLLQKGSPENVEDSPAFEGIQNYMKKNPKGRVLLITMENDDVVGGVVDIYEQIARDVDAGRITRIETPGGHGSTHHKELQAISKFIEEK